MTIKEGDQLPENIFSTLDEEKGPVPVFSKDIFPGKKVVLFAVPGAYTPTCTSTHCPAFVANANKLKKLGVDIVACTSVNGAFVLDAWGKSLGNNKGQILMLADGVAAFAKKIGMDNDLTHVGFGVRSKRYAMLVEDNVVKYLGVDEKGVDKSGVLPIIRMLEGASGEAASQ